MADKWNKRLLGLGSPDSYWSFPYAALSSTGLNNSFATFAVAASPGDRGEDAIADLGGRALHRALEVSRALTKKYYGRWKGVRSYYAGVEMGATAGLRSAQGSPGDFDGIVSFAARAREAGENVDDALITAHRSTGARLCGWKD